jgi:hypothetical protein
VGLSRAPCLAHTQIRCDDAIWSANHHRVALDVVREVALDIVGEVVGEVALEVVGEEIHVVA